MNCTKEALLSRINAAYAATKYRPIYGAYYDYHEQDHYESACPLTALANVGLSKKSPPVHGPVGIHQSVAKLLDVDLAWVNGFLVGFDGRSRLDGDEAGVKTGKYISENLKATACYNQIPA